MKHARTIAAAFFAALALLIAGFGIWLALGNYEKLPVLVQPSHAALGTADAMLNAVEEGDYALAATMILGEPDLGADREATGMVGRLLWRAYQESLEFTPVDECFTTETGIARQYKVRYLDIDSVTQSLRSRSEALLEERVASAKDVSELYNSRNEYREDLVMDVLCDAAEAALAEDAVYVERTFTVSLVFRDGKWWVLPESDLLSAITGGLAG